MALPPLSVAPEAATVTDAALDQFSEPPESPVGAVGRVRSILAVLPAPAAAGVQAETLPARSTLRTCTSVLPSAVMVVPLPVAPALQVEPLLVDVRYS